MRSILYQPSSPFGPSDQPSSCEPGRTETIQRFIKNGKTYTAVWRDTVTIEDPYLVMVSGSIYAIALNENYAARTPRRDYRDYLLKDSVVI